MVLLGSSFCPKPHLLVVDQNQLELPLFWYKHGLLIKHAEKKGKGMSEVVQFGGKVWCVALA